MKWNIASFGLLLCLLIASCSDDDPITPTPDPDPVEEVPDLMIDLKTDGTLGTILADEEGRTLYFFSRDIDGQSACMGGCVDSWPIYHIADLQVASGLDAADFSTITRSDGILQTTYRGWPLYYFDGDETAADTNGEGLNDVWWVAKPDYTIMMGAGQLVGHDSELYLSDYSVGEGMTAFLTDAEGRTLYLFVHDVFGTNNFTNPDFSNDGAWPIFSAELGAVPSTLSDDDFSMIDVHGRSQLTFKGWPLYYFGQDGTERGSTKGVSFPMPGIWPIANGATKMAPMPEMEAVSYENHIAPIMRASCAVSGCHNTASSRAGLDLSSYEDVKAIADNGKLVGTTFQEEGFSPMPRGREKLDDETLSIIKQWVDAGAENN